MCRKDSGSGLEKLDSIRGSVESDSNSQLDSLDGFEKHTWHVGVDYEAAMVL